MAQNKHPLLLLIVGASGSGKTAISEMLHRKYGLDPVISSTTREPRFEGETGHIFSHDVPDVESLPAYTFYGGQHYWVTYADLADKDTYIIDPAGLDFFKARYSGARPYAVIEVQATAADRITRMMARGDSEADALDRVMLDRTAFAHVDADASFVNVQGELDKCVDQIYQWYLEHLPVYQWYLEHLPDAPTVIDYKTTVENYVGSKDWRVKENSTVTYSVGGFILSNSGAITANYWLSEIYDEEIAKAHKSGDFHLHDLSMLTGYCAGWSLKQLIQEGLGGVTGKITSSPASHLSTLCNQMVNFLGIMQNEWAGAQAFSSFDTYLAPFVKVDNLSYKEVKQAIQSFVYGVNTPSRWGTQAPFSNITLDWTVPADLAELNCIVGGKEMPFRYKDCKKEMDMINKAFIEIMIEGDANGRGFQYPIPTYSITKDFDWSETENNKLLFEMTSKYGTPYFSNYVNSDMEPSDIRSMCPLWPREKVLVMDDHSKEFHMSTIENLYKGHKADKTYSIIHNGKIKKAVLHRFDGLDFYEVETVNGHKVRLSGNHLNLTRHGVKETKDLTPNDYLPFNTCNIEGAGLDYEDGLMVGAFLGDGSIKDDYSVVYSLNDDSKNGIATKIVDIATRKFGAKINTNCVSDHCINYSITSKMLRGLIDEYVAGKGTYKELNVKAINRSIEFRKGILDGYKQTDGDGSSRIYTSSKKMADSFCAVLASMGITTSVSVDNRDSHTAFSDNPIYIVRPYNGTALRRDEIFVKEGEYIWFKIKSIAKIKSRTSIGYCFEVLNDEEPYFMMPCGLVTHNCRLRLDLRELRKKSGGFFGSGESTGSIGVVTINLPRIAYLAEDEADFYKRLDHLMDVAARSLKTKRTIITKLLEEGLYPYTKRYLGKFDNHFSTIGLVGMNEAGLNAKWLRKDITTPETQQFAKDVLNHMRERLSDYQEQYGDLYNLEATPAESTSYRLAKHDKRLYPDIITAGTEEAPYYTNSSHLPVGYTEDIFTALDIQDELQTLYTSGTVFHAFLGEKLPDWQSAARLVRTIAENYKLPYYTLSPTYSVCTEHGYLAGEQYECPICKKKTEVYSRITGYYRPVQNWNDGKAQEFAERREYLIRDNKLIDDEPQDYECTTCSAPFDQAVATNAGDAVMSAPPKPLLFTSKTCPNCKIAKAMLAKANIEYVGLDPIDNIDQTTLWGITQAPTLVSVDGVKYKGVSEIRKWIEQQI